jgi:hypothetical protein
MGPTHQVCSKKKKKANTATGLKEELGWLLAGPTAARLGCSVWPAVVQAGLVDGLGHGVLAAHLSSLFFFFFSFLFFLFSSLFPFTGDGEGSPGCDGDDGEAKV